MPNIVKQKTYKIGLISQFIVRISLNNDLGRINLLEGNLAEIYLVDRQQLGHFYGSAIFGLLYSHSTLPTLSHRKGR